MVDHSQADGVKGDDRGTTGVSIEAGEEAA